MYEKLHEGIGVFTNRKFLYPFCNCLLIEDDINCLIDASPPDEDLNRVKETRIDTLINSHAHIDHIRCVADLSFGQLLLHPADHAMAASGEAYLDAFGFKRFPDDLVRPLYLPGIGYRERPADGQIEDGQTIDAGKIQFQVLHLPGHTAGHCGFMFPQYGLIFSGDITMDPLGPWYGNVQSSINDFINSINRLIDLQPDLVVPGHGPVISRGIPRRLARYRDILYLQEEKVLNHLKQGKHSIQELAAERIVYKVLPPPERVGFHYECVMVWKHLERLVEMDRVFEDNGAYYLV